jgi:cellulose synthase/poly-beta-1,6-N-acetylglucosamine synthase-like glycosyltransferase
MNSALRSAAVLSAALLVGSAAVAPQHKTDEPSQERRSAPKETTVAVPAPARPSDGTAELPRVEVEVPEIEIRTTGRTIHVPADGNLQAALDAANGGDRITLEPRATYRGPFRLRRKSTDDWIVITSAAPDLPKPGRHVKPTDAVRMPKLVAASGSVFEAEPGAHHFRLVGLEITPQEGVSLNTLVRLGESETTADAVPHHFIIDRCFIHGDARLGGRRGVALNASYTAVVDSYLSDFKERSVDAQAISGWNAPGPFKIARNFLEASGENVMFGGADPRIPDAVPSDIEVVQNHMAKPLRWKKDHPSFEGTEWSVKNLFELKNARRVRIDGNLLEYNWPQAQNGFAVLFTVRNQDGGAPWSVVEDVTFSNNLVRHVSAGINVLGRDDNHPSQQTQRITIRNNVFLDVGGKWGNGRLFQLLNGTSGIVIDHNTAMQTGSVLFADGEPNTKLVFQNNVIPHNEHGISGSGTAPGNASLQRYFPGAVFRRNVLAGGMPGSYPRDNFFPSSLSDVGLRGAGTDRTLRLEKTFAKQATDGAYPGADIDAVEQALGGLATVELLTARATPGSSLTTGNVASAGIGPLPFAGAAVAVFWISAAVLFYTYVGYPLIAALRGLYRRRQRIRQRIEPSVTIVVVAYNEADRICRRIENLLELDYARDRRTIVVASDGSTDDTVELARLYRERGVIVRAFGTRRGKAAVLNTIIPALRSDIVVFADARQRFERHTLRALVDNFSDPTIGAVGGELVLSTGNGPSAAGRGAAFYWRYEKFIRSTEASADSTIGASGAIYAIRRALFQPIADDTILDDVLIPLRIVRQGYRVVFEPRALAHDSAAPTARQEFVRKARTIAGTFQLFAREPWLLSPRRNRLWFETISHKGLRLTLPVFHAALFISACALATEWLYGWALIGQTAFYLAAFGGYSHRQRRSFVFTVPCAMCVLIWATVVGFIRFALQRQQVTWERTVWTNVAGEEPSPRAAG